ncbi:MAG TPA: hypothetical protein VFG91_05210 [Woeseiaceae bacterium]|nr:hypothetical protein [Woeseiaceae bacterium]
MMEEPPFYVPDLLSDEDYDVDPDAFSAADAHARHLRKAERLLNDAQNLARVLRESLHDAADARAMQADTVLAIIDNKLNKACRAVDKHGRRHSNLFLAYVEAARHEPD